MAEEQKKKDRPILTNSTADMWTDCQMKFKHRIEDGLSLQVVPPALSFGTLWHRFQEFYWQGLQNGATMDQALKGLELAIDEWEMNRKEQFVKYADRVNDHRRAMGAIWPAEKLKAMSLTDVLDYMNQNPKESIPDMKDMCREMGERFVRKYYKADVARWEVIAVEVQFRFPLKTIKGNRSAWDYMGKIDTVVRDRKTGLIYVIEHKTMGGRIGAESYKRELPLKPQPKGYLWAVRQLCGSGHGVIYNVARKKSPATPQVLKNPQQGRKLSIAKGTDTTPEIWLDAVKTHNPEMVVDNQNGPVISDEKYRAIYESLQAKGDTFLFRYELSIPDSDIAEWELDRWRVARSIGQARLSRAAGYTRNYESCFRIGRHCEFREMCLDREMGHLHRDKFIQTNTHGAPELDHEDEEESRSGSYSDNLGDVPFGDQGGGHDETVYREGL